MVAAYGKQRLFLYKIEKIVDDKKSKIQYIVIGKIFEKKFKKGVDKEKRRCYNNKAVRGKDAKSPDKSLVRM